MTKTTKKQEASKEVTPVVTRAEKKDATKNLIKECLAVKPHKHNELLDAVAALYVERFNGEDTDNINDVKGRIGSVLDIMKKESDIMYEGGMYALKARMMPEPPAEKLAEKPTKKTVKKTEKPAEEASVKKTSRKKKETSVAEEVKEEKPAKKTVKAAKATKKADPLPPAPLQPIAPVAPVTPETAPEPIPEEKPTPKKRGRKAKAVETVEMQPATEEVKQPEPPAVQPITEEVKQPEPLVEQPVAVKAQPAPVETPAVAEILPEIKVENPEVKAETQLIVKEKTEVAKKNVVMDMSFLFGDKKPAKPQAKEERKPELKQEPKQEPKQQPEVKQEVKPALKAEEKPQVKEERKPELAKPQKPANVRKLSETSVRSVKKAESKPLTADDKLREAFLKRLRSLGGDYFEYYSVYLLERYSMKNGRRLEGLKINGGDRDGGIDGEIELTDKLGFKETIYIQSKNWNPEKGDEKLWVVGETLLQQFIGACACRQAKDGKQHCRGIFITTSRFTPEAKRILDTMSDKIVGYDGNDLYEAAKECSFGLIEKNGTWSLDEKLLSSSKAFFHLY